MGRVRDEAFVHLAWTTWHRESLLDEPQEARAYGCLRTECERLRAEALAIGGTVDHVHLLLRLPTTVSIAVVAKQAKGASSPWLNHELDAEAFRWQGGYGLFSVSPSDVQRVVR